MIRKIRTVLMLIALPLFTWAQIESALFKTTVDGLLNETVPLITVSELQKMFKSKAILLLDAREIEERKVSHLLNSYWVGFSDFSMDRLPQIDKDSVVVVYCSVGNRSEKIGEKLQQDGYTEVYNLYGGIFEWINQNGAVYQNGSQTKVIHGYNTLWTSFIKKGEVVENP